MSLKSSSGRYLSFSERKEIALMRVRQQSLREIARRLGRSPSTISRELRRSAATRDGTLQYRATVAQWKADRAAQRPKPQTCTERPVKGLCTGAARWHGPRRSWQVDHRPSSAIEGTPPRPACRSTPGQLLEPRANQSSATHRFSGRYLYADISRSHIPSTVHSGAWCSTTRIIRLPTHWQSIKGTARQNSTARQVIHYP